MSTQNWAKTFMEAALTEAAKGMNNNEGGPFGAVIVKENRIIAKSHNKVVKTKDPTAHAEILAIRQASKKLGSFDLSDCEIYSTCEPCPMCLGAIHWAGIRNVHYGCTKEDAANIGFADQAIDASIKSGRTGRKVTMIPMERKACLRLFALWKGKPDKVLY
jgi:guanine deaminase